jgi:hypothetical protein
MNLKNLLCSLIILITFACVTQQSTSANADIEEWQQLFDGESLSGWDIKIRGHELNDNYNNTFQVKDGNIVVNYDEYDDFKMQYGHLFYKDKFSYYKIATEYRFVGNQAPEGEGWAFRNSGIMVHGQPAQSMGLNQDFPISIEVQLLGGFDDGKPRTTCNLCTPGTNVWYEGKLDTRHCINSTAAAAPTDEWVRAEVEVFGDSLIRHWVNGKVAMEYTKPSVGGGVVSGFDPKDKPDGQMLSKGTISLQSESHPIAFRKVELLNLKGCMNPVAKNFKNYYVENDAAACKF